jgi:hypothetical protein
MSQQMNYDEGSSEHQSSSYIIFGNTAMLVTPILLIAFGLICITIIAINAIFNLSR